VVILEVGLGGRLDAVNIIDADCAIITSIDLDHMEFLGPDRESIGRRRPASCAPAAGHRQRPAAAAASVIDRAPRSAPTCGGWARLQLQRRPQQWAGPGAAGATPGWPTRRCAAPTSCSTPRACWRRWRPCASACPVTAQAVRNGLAMVELPGRFQIVPGQPALVLDVAHNPHSVAALAPTWMRWASTPHARRVRRHGRQGPGPDAGRRWGPLVDRWYFTDLPTPAPKPAPACWPQWQASGKAQGRAGQAFADPLQALRAAVAAADPADRIVVFGSFYTVGGVLGDAPARPAPPDRRRGAGADRRGGLPADV
jgi:dihydrofolate synthase/folylpolyglutamate synthase